jgi:hypothetical protein
MADFRSEAMETREGRGIARRAWESYARGVNRAAMPLLERVAKRVSAAVVTDLVGFWLVWHVKGGFEGLEGLGMHRSTIFRKVARFRRVFGKHPDEFTLPGVTIDVGEYVRSASGTRK